MKTKPLKFGILVIAIAAVALPVVAGDGSPVAGVKDNGQTVDLISTAVDGINTTIGIDRRGTLYFSANGNPWHAPDSVPYVMRGVCHANGRFWAVGGGYGDRVARILSSKNGRHWLEIDPPARGVLHAIVHGNGCFVAVGSHGLILTSKKGRQWRVQVSGTTGVLHSVRYDHHQFVARGNDSLTVTSLNGEFWTAHTSGTDDGGALIGPADGRNDPNAKPDQSGKTNRQSTLLAAVASSNAGLNRPKVPTVLDPPANQSPVYRVHAEGAQIYTCRKVVADGTARFEWVFVAPEAVLYMLEDRPEQGRPHPSGLHYAGPTWEYRCDDKVVGRVLQRAEAPRAGAVPWLLLEAVRQDGRGLFADIAFIQRINTAGGVAPATGADSAHEGQEVRVPYSADYVFYKPAN